MGRLKVEGHTNIRQWPCRGSPQKKKEVLYLVKKNLGEIESRVISCQHHKEPRENHSLLKEQIRNIIWVFIILTHPSVLQELDFIIYTRGGGSWYFRPSSRTGLANFTPIVRIGHLISEPKLKIPTPSPPPPLVSDKSLTSSSIVVVLIAKAGHVWVNWPEEFLLYNLGNRLAYAQPQLISTKWRR